MNTVTLIGNLTKDPEIKNAKGETQVCRMRIAESNGPKDSPFFIDVAAFGRQAETCGRYLGKGRQVAVTGRLRFRESEKDGVKREYHSIAADRVDFLGSKKDAEGRRGERSDDEGGGEDF
jgi:single-strand DNA-binding protein